MGEALIPILNRTIGDSVNAVDARELHRALEVGRDFSTWIRSRIESLELLEGADYEAIHHSPDPGNGRPMGRVEYVIALDAAKHIAMAERNERGRRVRSYFIEAEKRSRDPLVALRVPRTLLALLEEKARRELALEAENERLSGELASAAETIGEMSPKAMIADRLLDASDVFGWQEACKQIKAATGANMNEVREIMLSRGWIRRLGGRLSSACIGEDRGYVTIRDRAFVGEDGASRVEAVLKITPKGIAKAIELILKSEAPS